MICRSLGFDVCPLVPPPIPRARGRLEAGGLGVVSIQAAWQVHTEVIADLAAYLKPGMSCLSSIMNKGSQGLLQPGSAESALPREGLISRACLWLYRPGMLRERRFQGDLPQP